MSALDPQLLARRQALGKMQARYLWFIVIAGLFFLQLRLNPTTGLKVPLIDLHARSIELYESTEQVVETAVTYGALGDLLREHGEETGGCEAFRMGISLLEQST